MRSTTLFSKVLPLQSSFEENVAPPRPPTKVRVISPELRDALQEKALATERAKKSGKPMEEAMIEEAEKIEARMARGAGPGRGPGPFGPPGMAGPAGYGYGGRAGSGYNGYGQDGYGAGLGPRGPSGRRRPMRFIPYKGSGKGLGQQGYTGNGPRQGGDRDGELGMSNASLGGGKNENWKLGPPDVVPWKGDVRHGPCDADDVFSVREVVRNISPLLIGSGCEKYVMDADKMLNDLPTDRGSDMIPACRNNYLVKSTAKTVYSIEKCAQKALVKAEHVNASQEAEIKRLVSLLEDRRLHVLVPLNSYAAPAKFNGHVKMSAKDWENFNNSDAAGTLANNWGGGLGSANGPGGLGRHGPRYGPRGQQWPGHGQQFGHGPHGGAYDRLGDSYGSPPHPEPPLQPGMVPGQGQFGPGQSLSPKQQHEKRVLDRARELAKANEVVVGPFSRGKHLEELPPPARPIKPIYPYPQPPILESETASVSTMPVYSGPDAPEVFVSASMPLDASEALAVGVAFLLLGSAKPGRSRRRDLATEFLAGPFSKSW